MTISPQTTPYHIVNVVCGDIFLIHVSVALQLEKLTYSTLEHCGVFTCFWSTMCVDDLRVRDAELLVALQYIRRQCWIWHVARILWTQLQQRCNSCLRMLPLWVLLDCHVFQTGKRLYISSIGTFLLLFVWPCYWEEFFPSTETELDNVSRI